MTATVRGVKIGSGYPVVIQSMTDTSTMDTAGSAAQCEALSDAGAQIVRLTTQGIREADNLAEIRRVLEADGYADISDSRRLSNAGRPHQSDGRGCPGW